MERSKALEVACRRAFDLMHNHSKPRPNGPFIKSPSTTKPEFRSTLETAVLSESSKSITTAIQGLGLKDGFKLFALPGIDQIDSDHELDDASRRRLQLIQNAADSKGWATYIARVQAVYLDDLPTDSASILAQFEDGESGFLRNLGGATQQSGVKSGVSEFQIMSVSDLNGTDVIPPYHLFRDDRFGQESRLRFQGSHRFLQANFFRRHHLDGPEEHEFESGTTLNRWTWSRDAVLLIPRSKVWDLLAPTIRPFFSARRVGGEGSQRHCDDNALGTLASHFFSNALSSLVAQRDRSHHQNACTTVYLIMQAIPSSRADIDMSLLVSALKFSYLYNEGCLFNYVSSHMAGDHDSVTNLATAVRTVIPLLADGPRGLPQAFAAESLHFFLAREKDVTSRLEAVKSFPQDLLPCRFTTAPLQRDALTLVLGANQRGIITHQLIEASIVELLWTFRHGEALADAIVTYGSGSIFQQEVLMYSTCLDDEECPPRLNPLIMGFIARLGQNSESESEEDEAARRLLQTNVAATFLELATDDSVDVTVKEATPDETRSAAPRFVDGDFEDLGSHMDPTHLALFVSEVASFANEEDLKALLRSLTPGCLRRSSQADFDEFRELWLPFWSCLVNMHGAPLQAYDYYFCQNMETYYEILGFRFKNLGRHPQGGVRSADSPSRAFDPATAASYMPDPEIYNWLTDPNSPAGLTATASLSHIEKYHGLNGEYLSSRVTPIPGTDEAQLLMVKRLPAPGGPHQNPKNKFEPTIRAEMEWMLFTEFRPMLNVMSEVRQSMIIGHSNRLDRDTSSLSAAYLEKWNVPSGDILELPACPETGAEDMPAMVTIKEEPQAQVNLKGEGGGLPRGLKRRATSIVEPNGGPPRRFRSGE